MRERTERILGGVAIAMAVAFATTEASAEAPRVEVRGDRGAVDVPRLEELVRLELREGLSSVVITMVGPSLAEVRVDRNGTAQLGRVALDGVSDVERTIALVAGELGRSYDESNGANRMSGLQEKVAPTSAGAARQTRAQPSDRAGAFDPRGASKGSLPATSREMIHPFVLAGVGARWFATDGGRWLAPSVELGIGSRSLRLGAIGHYLARGEGDPRGRVRVQALSAGIVAAARLVEVRRIALWTGPCLELGAAEARGEGSGGESIGAYLATTAWNLEGHASLGPAEFRVGAEAGWLARGLDVRSEDRKVAELAGTFAGVRVGIGLVP